MRVRAFTRGDLPVCNEIGSQAFEKDEFFHWLYPRQDKYPNDLRRDRTIRLRQRLVGLGQYGFVVVTEDGDLDWTGKPEVAGFAFYVRTSGDEAAKKWQADTLFKKLERKLLEWEAWYETKFLNRAQDSQRIKEYIDLQLLNRFKPMDPRWHLAIACVSPRYQRRGVGSLLIQRGQKLAADEGLPLTLEASNVGKKLYSKCGFKIVDQVKICEEYTDALMVWEPAGLEGTWLEETDDGTAKIKNAKKVL